MTLPVLPAPVEDETWRRILLAPLREQLREFEARGLPRAGVLILQNACENRCFFCANAGVTHTAENAVTRLEHIERWIDDARGVDVERLCVGGTEPALHPAFEDALRGLTSAKLGPIEVMTSGLRLAEAGVAERWAALGVRAVAVPLYAATARLHDEVVCHPGAFERTLAGLDGARAAGIDVLVHTLALRRTAAELPALGTLVRERYASRLALGAPRPKPSVWQWETEALTAAELEQQPAELDVSFVGYPLCVGRGKPRGSAAVIELYFQGSRREYAPECARCLERPSCPGVLSAEVTRGFVPLPRLAAAP